LRVFLSSTSGKAIRMRRSLASSSVWASDVSSTVILAFAEDTRTPERMGVPWSSCRRVPRVAAPAPLPDLVAGGYRRGAAGARDAARLSLLQWVGRDGRARDEMLVRADRPIPDVLGGAAPERHLSYVLHATRDRGLLTTHTGGCIDADRQPHVERDFTVASLL
jgi:hypothetical protein